MNDFKTIVKLVKKRKAKLNALYGILDEKDLPEYFKSLLALSELKEEKTTVLAILRRLIDLKEENLIQEWKKIISKRKKL